MKKLLTYGLTSLLLFTYATPGLAFTEESKKVASIDTRGIEKVGTRLPTLSQQQAIDHFKKEYSDATIRWNNLTGAPASIIDFATPSAAGSPEQIARDFLTSHSEIFGFAEKDSLVLTKQSKVFGGNLLTFSQVYNNIPVYLGGIGVIVNKNQQIIGVLGDFYRGIELNTAAGLSPAEALAKAMASLQVSSTVNEPKVQLTVLPSITGYTLAYQMKLRTDQPFGVFQTLVDANDGSILYREDTVRYADSNSSLLPFTADVFPGSPIEGENGDPILDANGVPLNLTRVYLRNVDKETSASTGRLAGSRTVITNELGPVPGQPFAQAFNGTYHFREKNLPYEDLPNEQDPRIEPAQHFDESNIYFYVNQLFDFYEDLAVRDDAHHNPIGEGDFPNQYPGSGSALPSNVHIPDPFFALSDPTTPASAYDYDNAFFLSVDDNSEADDTINFGHGSFLNDLAWEANVPFHEGTHRTATVIAGLNGDIEGPALNEAIADLFASTITENPIIGDYTYRDVNGEKRWIRNLNNTLKYSELCTRKGNECEEHRDGEIWEAAAWDLREQLEMLYPDKTETRPGSFVDESTKVRYITEGADKWERILWGALYVLGADSFDTFTDARDAMIISDAMLYPASEGPYAQGKHRSLIERVFAAHEIGFSAVYGGAKPTIATDVSPYSANRPSVAAPSKVNAKFVNGNHTAISWTSVDGAYAYEVLRRIKGTTVPFEHVDYVAGALTTYEDKGDQAGYTPAVGLNTALSYEYVVRALSNIDGVGLSPDSKIATVNALTAASSTPATASVSWYAKLWSFMTQFTAGWFAAR